MQLIRNNNQQ